MNEGKKDRRDPIRTVKPRNFVAKNAGATTSGAGAHKDKKKAMKQGDVKHKNKEYAEGLQAKLNVALAEAGSLAQQAAIAINMKKHHQKPKSEDVDQDEYSDEAGMAYGSLHTISRAANGLLDTIKEGDNLPEWCQEKISLAEDYLITVWDYLQSEKEQGVAEDMEPEDLGTVAEINRLIAKGMHETDAIHAVAKKYGDNPSELASFYYQHNMHEDMEPEDLDEQGVAEATPRHFGPKGAGTELARQTRQAEIDRKFNTPDQLKKDADYRDYRAGIKKSKVVAKKSQVKEDSDSELAIADYGRKILDGLHKLCQAIATRRPEVFHQLDDVYQDGGVGEWIVEALHLNIDEFLEFSDKFDEAGGDPIIDFFYAYQEKRWNSFIAPWQAYAAKILRSRGKAPSIQEQGVAEGKWSNVIHTTDRSDEKAQREQEHKKQAGLAATVLKNHSHALDPKEIDLLTRYNLHHRGKPGVRFDRLDNEKAQQLIQNVLRFNQQGVAEGAKVDRQAKHITASMMKKGKSKKDAEAIAWAHIKHPKKKAKEGWTHDSLADQLFEHERTYEDRLQNLLNKKLGK